MNRSFIMRLLVCVASAGLGFYALIDLQNRATELRIKLPRMVKELKVIEEENARLRYDIERFENPGHLMQLSKRVEFSHLKHPLYQDVTTLKQGVALALPKEVVEEVSFIKPSITLALGTRSSAEQ